MTVCMFCGGSCGRVCQGLGFKKTARPSMKDHNDSGGVGESRPNERQVADGLYSAGCEKPKRSGECGTSAIHQVGAKVQVAPQSPKATLARVTTSPPETTKRGRPRIGEEREKPWLKCKPPMSERTWYRRKKVSKDG